MIGLFIYLFFATNAGDRHKWCCSQAHSILNRYHISETYIKQDKQQLEKNILLLWGGGGGGGVEGAFFFFSIAITLAVPRTRQGHCWVGCVFRGLLNTETDSPAAAILTKCVSKQCKKYGN